MWYTKVNGDVIGSILENYTFLNLVKRVKTRLNDEEFSDDVIKEFLNEAQFEILGEDKHTFLEKVDEFDTSPSETELDLPRDYQSTFMIFAVDKDGNKRQLDYVPYEDFFRSKLFNKYTTFGNKVLFKIVDNSENPRCWKNNLIIQHLYLAKPTEMIEDDDEPVLPYEYSEALVYLALSRAERLRDNFDYAQIYENKAETLITNLNTRYGMRQMQLKNRARLPLNLRCGG